MVERQGCQNMPEIYFGTLQHLVTHFFNLERCSVARELRFELLLTDVLGIEDKVQNWIFGRAWNHARSTESRGFYTRLRR